MTWLFANVGGRKFILCALGIAAVVTLALAHHLEATEAVNDIVILVGIGAGSIALEDGINAWRGGTHGKTRA